MSYEAEEPFKKNAELSKLLNLSPEVIDAAQLKNYQGEELIIDARSNERRQKWLTLPGGIVMIACFVASASGFVPKTPDKEIPTPLKVVFGLAIAAYGVGRLSDREKQLRDNVRNLVINNAVERDIKSRQQHQPQ